MAVVPRKRARTTVYFVVTRGHWERVGTDRREADRLDARRRKECRAGTFTPGGGTGAQKVSSYAETWLRARKVKAADTEAQLIRDYVLAVPWFAGLRMEDVRPKHVIKLAEVLHETPPVSGRTPTLSRKTVANIFGILRTLFRDAVIDETIVAQPITLPRGTLSRLGARRSPYDVENVRALLAGARRPEARVFAALALYTGMREGEVCGRRWRDWSASPRPLGGLTVLTQYEGAALKTDRPRCVPVHPELDALLLQWWSEGWEAVYRRKPTMADFIVPPSRTPHRCYTESGAYQMWRQLLRETSVANLSLHSTRHTFITLARRGGAREEVLEQITHNARGSMVDQYTHWDWEPLCEAVLCLPSYASRTPAVTAETTKGAEACAGRGGSPKPAGDTDVGPGAQRDRRAPSAPDQSLDSRLTASRGHHQNRLQRLDSNPGDDANLTGVGGDGGNESAPHSVAPAAGKRQTNAVLAANQEQGDDDEHRTSNRSNEGRSHGSPGGLERQGDAHLPGGQLSLRGDGRGALGSSARVRAHDLHVHGPGEAPAGMARIASGPAGGRLGAGDGVATHSPSVWALAYAAKAVGL